MGVWHFLVTSLENPEDDFRARLRKNIVGVMCFPSGIANLFYGARGIVSYTGTNLKIASALTVLLGVVYVASYAWMRRTRTVSDTHMAIALWTAAILAIVPFLVFPEFDFKTALFCLQSLAVTSRIPGHIFYVVFLCCEMVVVDWNAASRQYPEKLWVLPDARVGTSHLTQAMGFWAGTMVMMVILKMFHGQVVESERRGAAQTAANDMTFRVLMRQRKYNTAEVRKILAECTDEEIVDPQLIHLFKEMNNNLESYRPFLPNYLFNDDDDCDENEQQQQAKNNNELRKFSLDDEVEGSVPIGSENDSGYATPLSDKPSSLGRGSRGNSVTARYGALTKRGELFHGRATFSLVDVCTQRLAPIDFIGKPSDVLKSVVQTIYSLAKETKASVHSMLGDTVQLTWNATSNTALPETKAALFLARLAKQLQIQQVNLNAAVCSGRANVHTLTSENQQAMLIEATWLPTLEACFDLAKRVGGLQARTSGTSPSSCSVVLMDDQTATGCRLEVETKAVEVVDQVSGLGIHRPSFLGHYPADLEIKRPTPAAATTARATTAVVIVHQLIEEYQRVDDEWMYQLQDNELGDRTNPPNPHLTALMLGVEGRFSEALQVLDAMANSSQSAPPTCSIFIDALRAKCEES